MNTKLYYIYRDASNYKLHFFVVMKGAILEKDMKWLLKASEDEPFYPSLYGFPCWTFVDLGYQPYDDDPDFYEITNVEETSEPPTVDMTAEDFFNRYYNRTEI